MICVIIAVNLGRVSSAGGSQMAFFIQGSFPKKSSCLVILAKQGRVTVIAGKGIASYIIITGGGLFTAVIAVYSKMCAGFNRGCGAAVHIQKFFTVQQMVMRAPVGHRPGIATVRALAGLAELIIISLIRRRFVRILSFIAVTNLRILALIIPDRLPL